MKAFCSFIRQLTFYGFKKIDRSDQVLEYQRDYFNKHNYSWISRIKRKRRLKKAISKELTVKRLDLERDNLSKKLNIITKLINLYEKDIKTVEQANKQISEFNKSFMDKMEERMVKFTFCLTFMFFNYKLGIGKKICQLFMSNNHKDSMKIDNLKQKPSLGLQTILDLSVKHFIMFKDDKDNKLDKFMNLVLVGNRNIIREEGFKEIFRIVLERLVIGQQEDRESTSRKISRFEMIVNMIEIQNWEFQRKSLLINKDKEMIQEELKSLSAESFKFFETFSEGTESRNSRSIQLFDLNFSDNDSIMSFVN